MEKKKIKKDFTHEVSNVMRDLNLSVCLSSSHSLTLSLSLSLFSILILIYLNALRTCWIFFVSVFQVLSEKQIINNFCMSSYVTLFIMIISLAKNIRISNRAEFKINRNSEWINRSSSSKTSTQK